jgi:hypothetical protein
MIIENKNCKISNIAWGVAILFLVGIFMPSIFGVDGMDGGFALSVGFGFLMMVSIVTAAVYGALAKEQDRILSGRAILAHWSYTQKEWNAFQKDEHVRVGEDKKYLFYIIAGWAIFFGILFPILDPEAGWYVTYTMLGLIVLIWVVMKISIYRGRKALETPSDVYISRFGVYFAGVMFSWRMTATKLTNVKYVKDKDCDFIGFEYLSGRSSGIIRVPVPAGKINEAKKIVEALEKER